MLRVILGCRKRLYNSWPVSPSALRLSPVFERGPGVFRVQGLGSGALRWKATLNFYAVNGCELLMTAIHATLMTPLTFLGS